MLDKDERDALREIEREITATDPDLAALLRGERRLAGTATRTCRRAGFVLLVLLIVVLLVLGLPASAMAVTAVAAGLWWRWGHTIRPADGRAIRRIWG